MKNRILTALCQRSGAGDVQHNTAATRRMIEQAVTEQPALDLIVFPEFNSAVPESRDQYAQMAEPIPGSYTETIAALARKYSVNIIPGSILHRHTDGTLRNTVPFIHRDGRIEAAYDKIHTMDAMHTRESDYITPGMSRCVVDADIGRIGILVCYDLRFPELARSLVLDGADFLICPAYFPNGDLLPPRTDHWDTLVAACALQNLTWVCAVNQYGKAGREYPFGRSRVVDPWGTVVAAAPNSEAIVHAALDLDAQTKLRKQLAVWHNRRPDLYRLK